MKIKSSHIYLALDHSGGPTQYPVAVGCVRIDSVEEAKDIIKNLRNYLRRGKFASAERKEIKWSDLKSEQRLWLVRRLAKSKLKFGAVLITPSEYEKFKSTLASKLGMWQYKLFGIWYSKAIEMFLSKEADVDVHIDRFLEDRNRNPTKEMWAILKTIENVLLEKKYSATIGLHDSSTDVGIQIADYVAGMVSYRKELLRGVNLLSKVNPGVKEELKMIARGARRTGMNPTSLNSKQFSKYLKVLVSRRRQALFQLKSSAEGMR